MADSTGLESLHDIHLPTAVSWWPPAPGWYVAAALLFLITLILIYLVCRQYHEARHKRQALRLLAGYEAQHQQDGQSQAASVRVSDLLRRMALLYYPRIDVAGLQGQAWIDFLNQTSTNVDFTSLDYVLSELPWRVDTSTRDLSPLFAAARLWIRQRGFHV